MADLIYALATPPGKSGVAVLRVSGAGAHALAQEFAGGIAKPRYAYYKPLFDASGEIIDEAIVIYFKAPQSFTGEDVVEFQTHGGRAVIEAVSKRFRELGARLAKPGEFTRRALENGRMNMLQVEALSDFIEADTEIQRKQSLKGLRNEAGIWVEALRVKLVEALALVTAAIDFSDEELPHDLTDQIKSVLMEIDQALEVELARSDYALGLRDGFRVVILGAPNVGKSSFLNKISGREVAITTDIPGTTRDVLEVFLDLKGLPVIFCDTAGLRETTDTIEKIGVSKALDLSERAHLRLWLLDAAAKDVHLPHLIPKQGDKDWHVYTKADLVSMPAEIAISSKTGFGVDTLLEKIENHLSAEPGFFSHAHQQDSLRQAYEALASALSLLDEEADGPYEIIAEYLRHVVFALDRLIGRVDIDDLLDVIFSRFCLGK